MHMHMNIGCTLADKTQELPVWELGEIDKHATPALISFGPRISSLARVHHGFFPCNWGEQSSPILVTSLM